MLPQRAGWAGPQLRLNLLPNMASPGETNYVSAILHVQLPAHYPRKQAAIFRVEKGKGLSDADVANLQKKIDQAVC